MMSADPLTDSTSWIRAIAALAFVVAMMCGLASALKYAGNKGFRLPGALNMNNSRLKVVESTPLDIRRRVVIVKCDDKEHLLLLGINQDIVIESDISRKNYPPEVQVPL